MKWEVFRQSKKGDYHVHVGNVHAPSAELAKQFAQIMHARRKPANSLWLAPSSAFEEVDADGPGVAMGGTTDKAYRWATNYTTDETFADEIAASQREQEEAAQDRAEVDG